MTATRILLGVPLLLLVGCTDVEMPSGRYIGSVRVLGVQAEPPTLWPGGTTHLSVACADGRQGPQSAPDCNVEVAWFGNCHNPPDNDPEKCMAQYGALTSSMAPHLVDTAPESYPAGFGFGPTLEFTAPPDILASELEVGSQTIRYGVSYVYFMVCAGRIVRTAGTDKRLPVECNDRVTDRALDQRSKVVGVTTIYSYDLVRSMNPQVTMSVFDFTSTPPDCSVAPCPANHECSANNRCVPVVAPCTQKGSAACAPHAVMLALSVDGFSLFGADGTRIDEPKKSAWLDLYANAGHIDDEARFALRAPAVGQTDWVGPPLYWWAPPFATEHAHVWAVIRDNRGGLTVFDQPVIVR